MFVLQATADQPSGVSVNISRSAAPASPARHLLQDISDDGVDLTITITAPASQMHNVSNLVQSVVQSSAVRRQLQEAGNTTSDTGVYVCATCSAWCMFCLHEIGGSIPAL